MNPIPKILNGVKREDYFAALQVVSDAWNLPPYKVSRFLSEGLIVMKKCPKCDVPLHETNTEKSAPRNELNALQEFKQGDYGCKSCEGEW